MIAAAAALWAAIAGTAYALYRVNHAGIKSLKTMSHIAALDHGLRKYFTDHPDWPTAQPRPAEEQWVALEVSGMRKLLADAVDPESADRAVPGDVTVDAWRRPLRVELSTDRSGRVHHRITSFGPDGVVGTRDDIVFGSGAFSVPATKPF